METKLKTVTKYLTSDGLEFDNELAAKAHEHTIAIEPVIEKFLSAEYPVASDRHQSRLRNLIKRFAKFAYNEPPVLEDAA